MEAVSDAAAVEAVDALSVLPHAASESAVAAARVMATSFFFIINNLHVWMRFSKVRNPSGPKPRFAK